MMQEDNVVTIGGEARHVDLTSMPEVIHAVQYDSVSETGIIEYDVLQEGESSRDVVIKNKGAFQRFQPFVDAWNAGGDAPDEPVPTPVDTDSIIDNTYNNSKSFQTLVDYIALKEGRPSTDVLLELKALALT